LDIDVVAECTGVFNSFEKSSAHLEAGAKRVVLSGPTKDTQGFEFSDGKMGATVIMGVNDEVVKTCAISSNASCTTNAAGTPLDILQKSVGIESAFLNTIHSYTATQSIVDAPSSSIKDFRRGRAAAQNIIPTSTGSAIATGKVIESLQDKFDGMAIRVPTVSGSLVDITFITQKDTSVDEINQLFLDAEKEDKYTGILRTESDQIVSSDIVGDTHAAIVDLNFTKVKGRLVKIVVWYDNEAGFTNTLLKQIILMGKSI
jgi:glyceraldehyde 3-phosphate dehydrogenase